MKRGSRLSRARSRTPSPTRPVTPAVRRTTIAPSPHRVQAGLRITMEARRQALRELIDRQWDLALPRLSRLQLALGPVPSAAFWLTQVFLGAIIGSFIKDLAAKHTLWDWDIVRDHWLVIPVLVIMIPAYLTRRTTDHKARRTQQLQDALSWFSEEMGFGNLPGQDIRCTIWTPTTTRVDKTPIRMRQLVNYEPPMSQIPDALSSRYRKNGPLGRISRVSRTVDGVQCPIGILGKAAFQGIYNRIAGTYVEIIPDAVDFQTRMIENWNFTRAEAEALTQDRRSYIAICLMDHNQSRFLAVLYCDSRDPAALALQVADKAAKHLPYIARIITSH